MAGDTDAPINYEEYASEICNDNENVNVPIPCGTCIIKIFTIILLNILA